MRFPQLRWSVVATTFLVCAGILFGGHQLWRLNAVQKPLQNNISQIAGVAAVDIDQHTGRIALSLEPEADFVQTASAVNRLLLEESMARVKPDWIDAPSEALLSARNKLDLILREAQQRHEYVLMEQRLAASLADSQIVYQLGVDERWIYLCLQDESSTLLDVIPITNNGGDSR